MPSGLVSSSVQQLGKLLILASVAAASAWSPTMMNKVMVVSDRFASM
jgi:hypothetical protein